jgi:hypothetical protein
VFLLFDILAHATEPVEEAMTKAKAGEASWSQFAGLSVVYALGFGAGLLGLLYATRWWKPRPRASIGPGAMAAAETDLRQPGAEAALRVGMSIAIGIGLHNFSEGLAVGQAAKAGEVSLAVLLIIGFALHNATEGFGIVGPLAAAKVRPSWGWLGLAGLIGGGPTVLGEEQLYGVHELETGDGRVDLTRSTAAGRPSSSTACSRPAMRRCCTPAWPSTCSPCATNLHGAGHRGSPLVPPGRSRGRLLTLG